MPEPQLPEELEPGYRDAASLSLSGGGYRAMVFHVGALWRLNQCGLLKKFKRISSVSGGSITAGVLGLCWKDLGFRAGVATRFDLVVSKIRQMSETSIDVGAVIGGILFPGTISDRVAGAYDRVLFNGASLRDLPDDSAGEVPRFVLNATSIHRRSVAFLAYVYGGLPSRARAQPGRASLQGGAFPPILSPATLDITQPVEAVKGANLSRPPFTTKAVLSDGGVYDNLGLETVKGFGTLLVSDAGQKVAPEEAPHHDWARHAIRILDTIDNQVRSLRKRHLIDAFRRGDHTGTYWGIRAHFPDYQLREDPLDCLQRNPLPLAEIPTRLERLEPGQFEKLVNWGYAVCDAALRAHIDDALQTKLGIKIEPPAVFPFPGGY